MKKKTARKLSLTRESLKTLENLETPQGGSGYNTVDPCYPYSYPRSACPGDTC